MDIEFKKPSCCKFKDVEIGQVFSEFETFYIKIEATNSANAIDRHGKIYHFDDEQTVTKYKAKLYIEED